MDKKQVLSAMETDVEKSLADFNAAAGELLNSTYIIVSGKLSKLLQSIASSRPLYEFLAENTRGYNFVEEFRSRQFRDESGKAYIDVPTEPAEQMRFAFCLLFAIDTGKLNVENLLHTFYNNSDANTELRDFCADIVKPFVENLNAAFCASSDARPSDEGDAYADVDDCEHPQACDKDNDSGEREDSLTQSVRDAVSRLIGIIASEPDITTAEREDLLTVCDAFSTAVGLNEYKAMRVMYVALKTLVTGSPAYSSMEEQFSDLAYLAAGLGIRVE